MAELVLRELRFVCRFCRPSSQTFGLSMWVHVRIHFSWWLSSVRDNNLEEHWETKIHVRSSGREREGLAPVARVGSTGPYFDLLWVLQPRPRQESGGPRLHLLAQSALNADDALRRLNWQQIEFLGVGKFRPPSREPVIP